MGISSDGVVTATVDLTTASVLLLVDFTAAGSAIKTTAATTVYSVTVTEGTTGNQVRGFSAAPGGITAGIDHESPLGSGLSYVARAYGATGNLLATSTAAAAAITIPSGRPDTWLKSLATPKSSVNVDASANNQLEWATGITEGRIDIINRPDPIVVQDVRQYGTSTLEVMTTGLAAGAALDALLHTPGPYLLQMSGYGQPDRYVTVGPYSGKTLDPYSSNPTRVWPLPLTQVGRPPVAGWSVAIPGKTYADSAAALPLYSNRTGTYLSRSQ